VWNNNYNIKPREIARAQEALTDVFQETYASDAGSRDMVRLLMSTVGRGGQGNGGQVRPSSFTTSAVYGPLLASRRYRMLKGSDGNIPPSSPARIAAHPRRDIGHSARQQLHGRVHGAVAPEAAQQHHAGRRAHLPGE
jgi:hypothetical protein